MTKAVNCSKIAYNQKKRVASVSVYYEKNGYYVFKLGNHFYAITEQQLDHLDDVLSPKDLSQLLGLSYGRICAHMRLGLAGSVKKNNGWVIYKHNLIKWINKAAGY